MKKLLTYFFIFLVLFSTILVTFTNIKEYEKDKYLKKQVNDLNIKYQTVIKSYSKITQAIFDETINKSEIIEIFQEAKNASKEKKRELRSELYKKLYLIYAKSFNIIRVIQFHLPNGESFLRLHKPSKFGDNLFDIRESIKIANSEKRIVKGFEEGRVFNGFRYVYPLFDENRHIGSVELSISFDIFRNDILELFNSNIFLLMNKNIVNSIRWEKELNKSYSIYNENYYLYKNSTNYEVLKEVSNEIDKKLKLKQNFSSYIEYKDKHYILSFLALKNVSNKFVGYIVSYEEDSVISKYNLQFKFDVILATIFLISIMVSIYFLLEKRTKILKLNKKLKAKVQKSSENLQLLNEYKRAVDVSNIVSKTNKKGFITYVNDEFCRISGYSQNELLGKKHNILFHPDMPKKAFSQIWKTIINKQVWKGVIKHQRKDGGYYFVDTTIIPILDINREIKEFITTRHDVTELLEKDKKIKEQTLNHLTKLPNRIKLIEDIKNSTNPTLATINIDSFSEINDFYGLEIGDEVIIQVATILKKVIDNRYNIYNWDGDKYAILLDNSYDENEAIQRVTLIVKNLSKTLDKTPIKTTIQNIYLNITAGIARGKENLLINANTAFKNAKINKKHYSIYNKSLNILKSYEENLKWIKVVKEAYARNDIVAFFQPIINNKTGKIEKYESLVRILNEGKVISPFFFLDISKKAKLYPKITTSVLESAFRVFKDSEYEFSINLSVEDILNLDTIAILKSKLEYNDIAKRVVLEIVESEGIENFNEVNEFINDMKKLGCKIAIDDFGTGYSNFQYLSKLNIDYIKIDGSLIKNIDKDETTEIITRTIVNFAKELNIKTVAEFVHSKEVLDKVKSLGIDYSQGFYLGEPSEKI